MYDINDLLVNRVPDETPADNGTWLVRVWVSILREDGVELVRRRSVILCGGPNKLELAWKPRLEAEGRPAKAALFCNVDAAIPRFVSSFICPATRTIGTEDSVVLYWEVCYEGGDFINKVKS